MSILVAELFGLAEEFVVRHVASRKKDVCKDCKPQCCPLQTEGDQSGRAISFSFEHHEHCRA